MRDPLQPECYRWRSRDAVDIHSSCALVPPPSPRNGLPAEFWWVYYVKGCGRTVSRAAGGVASGGHDAPGRAPCCVRAAAIMASPSLRRRVLLSAGRWRGGLSPLPPGAPRPRRCRGMVGLGWFVVWFFFFPFPAPPSPSAL